MVGIPFAQVVVVILVMALALLVIIGVLIVAVAVTVAMTLGQNGIAGENADAQRTSLDPSF